MTDKERIARLAREAQVYAPMGAAPTDWWVANIERFAELVATSALQEAHAELDALRAERDALRVKAEAGAQVMRGVFYPGVAAGKEGA